MNASDILKYGHQTLMKKIDGFPKDEWKKPGACGTWSAQDIIAHLVSYEQVLQEVLSTFLGETKTPALDAYRTTHDTFNDTEVSKRKNITPEKLMEEYESIHTEVMGLIAKIPEETLRKPGTIPWYGNEYSLDDFIVYANYGHKREHAAQIAFFKDTMQKVA